MPFWKKKKPVIPEDIKNLIDRRHQNTIKESNNELIVDDNQVNRTVLTKYLANYKTVQASNGLEALQKIVDTNFHIIWIDLNMPILNGIETMKYLRADYPKGFGYKGFIVTVTGYADQDSRNECINAGANVVLCKPYAGDHIIRIHQHPFFKSSK